MSWNTEYPRPHMRRESFISLNGIWKLNGRNVTIPFPPESELSGYTGENNGIYEYVRCFDAPVLESGQRLILHFGAVDQIAEVFINARPAVMHEGGYLPFSCDITGMLIPGENRILIKVTDDLDHAYPYGKQKKARGGMWYTPVSGIWQSVWMEVVPDIHIHDVKFRSDAHGFDIFVDAPAPCELFWEDVHISVSPGSWQRVEVENPHLWSHDDPYIYDAVLRCGADRVATYFALREVSIRGNRVLLNGEPIFLNGVLDQGYFPDGIYLPGDPDEYMRDILRMKELGMNLLRKHIKIEPEVFYYACDRLGMLVMQDMVNSGPYSFIFDTALPTIGLKRRPDFIPGFLLTRRMNFFTEHAKATVEHLVSHPSVIAYTIFNEGWGQFNADQHYAMLKALDPTRLYDATSGWFTRRLSDFDSEHVYFRNKHLKPKKRPLLLSECGGYTRDIPGHRFNENAKYGYGGADTEDALTAKIEKMWAEMVLPAIPDGLCGVIYTQLSDVEDEINGLYTYDRKICKVDKSRIRGLMDKAASALKGR